MRSFAERFSIVSRAHTGKQQLSPEKELDTEHDMAYLGTLCGILSSEKVGENDFSNEDEKHFIINMDKGRSLGFVGDTEVKYTDIVSGGKE